MADVVVSPRMCRRLCSFGALAFNQFVYLYCTLFTINNKLIF